MTRTKPEEREPYLESEPLKLLILTRASYKSCWSSSRHNTNTNEKEHSTQYTLYAHPGVIITPNITTSRQIEVRKVGKVKRKLRVPPATATPAR
jgi:hypothetical protein|nr:hypothetical protein Q903MT_gene3237 [Picea sitchensis]